MKLKINREARMFAAGKPNEYYLKEIIEGTDRNGNLMYTCHFVPLDLKDLPVEVKPSGFKVYQGQQVMFICIDDDGEFLYWGQKKEIANWTSAMCPEKSITDTLEEAVDNPEITCWAACDYVEDGEWKGKPSYKSIAKYFWGKKPDKKEWEAVLNQREMSTQLAKKDNERKIEQIEDDDEDLPF